ncbi:MAG: hypothetical protein GWP91_16280 [Rhodobacterales bacterium]|nr:hypothetical protein [Rhodobacterales bacterium]
MALCPDDGNGSWTHIVVGADIECDDNVEMGGVCEWDSGAALIFGALEDGSGGVDLDIDNCGNFDYFVRIR